MENREQIIKALEEMNTVGVSPVAIRNAIKLIKELTQAHEMLSESYDHLEKTKDELLTERSRLTEENERIGIENFDLVCKLSRIAEDTVRKMQEMLHEQALSLNDDEASPTMFVEIETVDKVAKEIIEGGSS